MKRNVWCALSINILPNLASTRARDRLIVSGDLFDFYYFCLIAGLISGRSVDAPASDLTEHYVDNYKLAGNFLVGLLIVAELKKTGIDLFEKDAVRNQIRRLVDPRSPNQLTDEGMRRINSYANGGYERLAESRDTKPYSGEEFLVDYTKILDEIYEDASQV